MTRTTTPALPTFGELGLVPALVDTLARDGFTEPFPIQAATIPDALAGRDVLGRGRTGSGKTLGFSLPLLSRLATERRRTESGRPRALILVPTRELATQVNAVIAPLAKAAGLSSVTVFGGVAAFPQIRALQRGVDVVVACPGRLEDHMRQGHLRLDAIEITVLDEADHMADLGFLPAVRRILDATPADGQRMLFSATLDNDVDALVRRFLKKPVTHDVVDPSTPAPDMEHHVLTVANDDKPEILRELASGQGRSVLFTRTKHTAKNLARKLTASGIPAVDLHGNLSQKQRQRNLTLFRDGEVRVLVATDVAARGIHVDDVALVVHVDPPAEHKAYLHRSGRTARAGASGVVVTLQTRAQRRGVAMMTKRAGVKPAVVEVRPGSPEIVELTGPPAALVDWTPPVMREDKPRTRSSSYGKRPYAKRAGGAAAANGAPKHGASKHGAAKHSSAQHAAGSPATNHAPAKHGQSKAGAGKAPSGPGGPGKRSSFKGGTAAGGAPKGARTGGKPSTGSRSGAPAKAGAGRPASPAGRGHAAAKRSSSGAASFSSKARRSR